MQMPRGGNNRLDEANRDRNNANRLFDSQNNNRGGYNVGSVYYTTGSKVYTQWTNQHSCNAGSNKCEIILQYMCDPLLRDGTTTSTIPTNNAQCYENDCDTDLEYGRFESYEWYYNCSARQRNMGLFTSNQNLNGRDARFTRQNPNGQRYGYECAEERDYYPYWYPSPWVDIAILTDTQERCDAYQAQSENVKGRGYCDPHPLQYLDMMANNQRAWIPNNEEECKDLTFIQYDAAGEIPIAVHNATWRTSEPHNVAAPLCTSNWWSRDNQLGNVIGGYTASINFTAPEFTDNACAMRMRYNITTMDVDIWESDDMVTAGLDYTMNSEVNNPNPNEDPDLLPIWEIYGLTADDVAASFDDTLDLATSREYVHKNDPDVDIFGDIVPGGLLKLEMNVNTNQHGRVFQDRSHRYELRENTEPECDIPGQTVHNVQVRGKRGNVVQTFPGTEYDFVPEQVEAQVGDCIHFQWTGSNTNPNNNAGQGRQGTDRTNLVVQRQGQYDEAQGVMSPSQYGQWGANFPVRDLADPETALLGWDAATIQNLAIQDLVNGLGGEVSELDDRGPYFDNKPKVVNKEGVWHVVSTRQNNFSNRSCKGKIKVSSSAVTVELIGSNGGMVAAASGASIEVPAGMSSGLYSVETTIAASDAKTKSDWITIGLPDDNVWVTVSIPFESGFSITGQNVRFNANTDSRDLKDSGWSNIRASYKNGYAEFEASESGTYVVANGAVSIVSLIVIVVSIVASFLTIGWCMKCRDSSALPWLPMPQVLAKCGQVLPCKSG